MVRQFRTGRYGQPLSSGQQQVEQITPEQIREEPQVPAGRFGRGLKATEALRARSSQISNIRREAMEEAQRLEREFFSGKITIAQAEEAYGQVDPLVRQFITTTPTVRRQLAQQALAGINQRILNEEANIQRLRSGSPTEMQEVIILEKEQLIRELSDLRDEAESGAFDSGELLDYAESRSRARGSRVRERLTSVKELVREGVPLKLARQVTSSQNRKKVITSQEAQELSPQALKALGIEQQTITETITTTRPYTLQELADLGINPLIARKLLKGEASISIEEARSIPSATREMFGLTDTDFEKGGVTTTKRISELESLKERMRDEPNFFKRFALGLGVGEAKIRDVIDLAGDKVVQFRNSKFQKQVSSFAQPKDIRSGRVELSGTRLSDETAKKITTIGLDVASFTVPAVSTVRGVTFVGSVGGRLAVGDEVVYGFKPVGEKQISSLEVVSAVAIASAGVSKILKEPVILAKDPVKIKITGATKIGNIQYAGRGISLAQFEVEGVKSARRAFVTTRGEILRSKVFGLSLNKPLKSISIPEAQLAFQGRVVTIERASKVRGATELFITAKGKVLAPALRTSRDVGIITQRAGLRASPFRIGAYRGAIEPNVKELRLISPKTLSKLDQKLLARAGEGVLFKRNAQLFKGDTYIKDLYKVSAKGDIKLLSAGEIRKKAGGFVFDIKMPSKTTTARGRFVGVQEFVASRTTGKQTGIIEQQIFRERMAFADVTYPRVPRLKKLAKDFNILAPTKVKPVIKGFESLRPYVREYQRLHGTAGFYVPENIPKLNLKKGEIYLDFSIRPSKFKETFRHELVHAIDDELKISETLTSKALKAGKLEKIRDTLVKRIPSLKEYPREQYISETLAKNFAVKREFTRLKSALDNPYIELPPRRTELLVGKTDVFDISLDTPEGFNTISRIFTKRLPKQFRLTNQKQVATLLEQSKVATFNIPKSAPTISQIKGATALKVQKELMTSRRLSSQEITRQFAGFGTSRTLDITKTGLASIPKDRFEELTRLDTRLQSKTETKTLTRLSDKFISKELTRTQTKQTSRLSSRLSTRLSTRVINQTITIPPSPPFNIPRSLGRRTRVDFDLPSGKPRKRRKKRGSGGGEGFALAEGFTARILRLPPQRIRASDIGKALERQSRITSIRLRPMIIPDFTARKRKRRSR